MRGGKNTPACGVYYPQLGAFPDILESMLAGITDYGGANIENWQEQ